MTVIKAVYALVLDLGGVVTVDPLESVIDFLQRKYNLSEKLANDAGRAAWETIRHGPSSKVSERIRAEEEHKFWQLVIDLLQIPETPESLAVILRKELRLTDPGWIDLLRDCRRASVTPMILSNNLCFTAQLQLDLGLQQFFEPHHVFLSCDIECSKSSGKPFDILLDQTGCPAHRMLFVDDRKRNVEQALERSIPSVLIPADVPYSARYVRYLLEQMNVFGNKTVWMNCDGEEEVQA